MRPLIHRSGYSRLGVIPGSARPQLRLSFAARGKEADPAVCGLGAEEGRGVAGQRGGVQPHRDGIHIAFDQPVRQPDA
ncbi:hypothetical protein D3C71_1967910 [compost metagenome]